MRVVLCLVLLLLPVTAQALERTDAGAKTSVEAAAVAPHEKPAAKEKTFNAEHFTLTNGMEVVVISNPRAPVVTHMIWYKVGAADEQPGLSGMAHYFEHLMFKGTADMAPGDYSKRIKVLGGNDNAFTGQDFTAYFATISTDNLPDVMKMEADRMQNLNPPPEHFASEKAVVLEERRQRTDNDPRAQFGEQLQSLLYINHPYGTPVIGWMDEIRGYEWEQVRQFYDAWYAPNNAILIVSGDMTAERLRPLAEEIYGSIPAKDLPPRARPSVPPAPAGTKLYLRHSSIHQPVWQSLALAPAYAQNKNDALALQVLEDILSGGPTTRLYDSLVVRQKKAVSVSLSYNGTALDYGTLSLSAIPADNVSLATLEALVREEIRKVIDHGVTQEELSESITRLQDEAVYARDSLSGPAMIVGYGMTTSSSLEDIENWPNDIAEITAEDVRRVAAAYLDPHKPWIRPPVNGYLLPEGKQE